MLGRMVELVGKGKRKSCAERLEPARTRHEALSSNARVFCGNKVDAANQASVHRPAPIHSQASPFPSTQNSPLFKPRSIILQFQLDPAPFLNPGNRKTLKPLEAGKSESKYASQRTPVSRSKGTKRAFEGLKSDKDASATPVPAESAWRRSRVPPCTSTDARRCKPSVCFCFSSGLGVVVVVLARKGGKRWGAPQASSGQWGRRGRKARGK